jgi:hypothetical protein
MFWAGCKPCCVWREYPAPRLLARLGQEAAEFAGVASKSGCVVGAIQELSIGMCRGNLYAFWDGYGLLAGTLAHAFRPDIAGQRML